MKVKVSEASGTMLDWMVAKAEGHLEPTKYFDKMIARVVLDPEWWGVDNKPMLRLNPAPDVYYRPEYDPSENWAQGGPIIEREKITVLALSADWEAQVDGAPAYAMDGPTPLIAAMRCFCASKLGEEVEVPDALC